MEADRFDALVRAASQAGSRRGLLGGLAALALAPLTTAQAKPAPAACLPVGKRCTHPTASAAHAGQRGKKPPACSKCCSRFGVVGADGKAHCTCKGEGTQCDNASQCCGGQCRNGSCTGCPGNTVFCTDGCADLQTNNQHCGSCANACAAGQRCVIGSCACDATSCPTGCCDVNHKCQRGTSVNACGDNGATCAICLTGETCDGDTCVCASGVICSVSGCCASADQVCDQNDQCCTPDCAGKVCGDADGCGGMCTACPSGQTCLGNGTCVLPCASNAGCPSGCTCATIQGGRVCVGSGAAPDCNPTDPASCAQGQVCAGAHCFFACAA